MARINVILPVYNGEKYIRESVQSILNQSFKDFTLTVLDDGSTDNTPYILDEFKDIRISIVRNLSNVGLIKTLNKGLSLSRDSQYIARMDADDICVANRFAIQYSFMKENPSVDILGGAFKHFDDRDKSRVQILPRKHSQIVTSFLCQNAMAHPTILARAEVFQDRFYSESFPKYEDYALWTSLATKHKFHNVDDILLLYRRHANNVTTTYENDGNLDFNIFSSIIRQYTISLEKDLSDPEIILISTLTGKSRYKVHPNLGVDVICNQVEEIVGKFKRPNFHPDYLKKILAAKALKYFLYYKRFGDIPKLLYKLKLSLNVREIYEIECGKKAFD